MEKQAERPRNLTAQRTLEIYVALCAILVLIILYTAFKRTDGSMLAGEIYLRPAVAEAVGN